MGGLFGIVRLLAGNAQAHARHCLAPLHPDHPCQVMPVFSSGQTVLQAAPTLQQLGSTDLIFCAGGGVVAHPAGIAAGVTSLRQAWEAAEAGVPLSEAAASSRLLKQAVETFS